MNDIRRTILWVIFGFSMVLLWDQFQVYSGKKATFFPAPVQQAATAAAAPASATSGVPAAVAVATPGAAAQAAVPAAAPSAPKERFEVTTDVGGHGVVALLKNGPGPTLMLRTDLDPEQANRRHEQAQGSYWLTMIDIDHFKRVNDNYGHLIGDEVLLLLARLMRATFRFHDQLYRFGGEEFVVLLRCADHADVSAVLGVREDFCNSSS